MIDSPQLKLSPQMHRNPNEHDIATEINITEPYLINDIHRHKTKAKSLLRNIRRHRSKFPRDPRHR